MGFQGALFLGGGKVARQVRQVLVFPAGRLSEGNRRELQKSIA